MSGPARTRGLDVLPFPSSRRAVTAAVRAGRRIVPMHGLVEVDVTEARRLLADQEPPLSTTAFVIAAVARTVAAHPEVHAYRGWRGRLARHRHVDVQTLVEVPTEQGPFGLVHVVRDADIRDVADISTELSGVKADMASTATGRALQRLAPIAGRVPGVFPGDVRAREPLGARAPARRHRAGDRRRDVRRRRRFRHRFTHPCLDVGRRRRPEPAPTRRR